MSSLTATTFFFLGTFAGILAAVVVAAVVLGVLALADRRHDRRAHQVRVPDDASSLTREGHLVGHRA